ncbi:MAG: HEPN domain-containing protein [Candidatus Bipolaricaulaceae bacterium]
MPRKTEKIAALLEEIVYTVERTLGVELSPEEAAGRGRQALPVFVHELLHAALGKAVPGVSDPTDPRKDLAHEIVVRVLEREVCENLGLPSHSWEEHAGELRVSFPQSPIGPEDLAKFAGIWRNWRDLSLLAAHVFQALAFWGLPIDNARVVDKEEFARWWRQAQQTMGSARRDKEAGDYAWACFKAEQAGKFALKGLLRAFGEEAFGYSTSSLAEKITALGITVPDEIVNCARQLERHYIASRYPDVYPTGTPSEFYQEEDANRAIRCAQRILSFVEKVWQDAQGP